jgi:hypothetical protein
MGMDFSTQEKWGDVEVLRLDDLVQPEVNEAADRPPAERGSWFSLIFYWISELRWRARYWNKTRG